MHAGYGDNYDRKFSTSVSVKISVINIMTFNTANIVTSITSHAAYNQYSVEGVVCIKILFIFVMKQIFHIYAELSQQKNTKKNPVS